MYFEPLFFEKGKSLDYTVEKELNKEEKEKLFQRFFDWMNLIAEGTVTVWDCRLQRKLLLYIKEQSKWIVRKGGFTLLLLFRKSSKSSIFLFNKQDRQNVENFVQIFFSYL